MCSELDDKTNTPTKPPVSNNKHITFEQGTNDGMSESEDDDIGSEELMCNENIDVNDKESDDSDEEELTNRVFPQQRFKTKPDTRPWQDQVFPYWIPCQESRDPEHLWTNDL